MLTTNMRAGYLRKNGVPYSANAKLTEFYDRTHEDNGDFWLVVNHHRGRSATPPAALYHQHPFQTGKRRLEVALNAVYVAVEPQRYPGDVAKADPTPRFSSPQFLIASDLDRPRHNAKRLIPA